MKRHWFNFRALCLIFAFLLLGSLFGFYIIKQFVICLIVALIILNSALIIAIINKKPASFLIPIICFLVGFSCYNLAIDNFAKSQQTSQPNIVSARIYNLATSNNNQLVVCLDSLKFDGKSVKGRAKLAVMDYQNRFDDFSIGTEIEFSPYSVATTELLGGDIPFAYYYTNDIKYYMTSGYTLINITGHDTTFAEKIQAKVKENLAKGLSNENVELAYAALFGDKSLLPEEQYAAYQLSGAAHILAVSGLHVSIIVGVLYAFCKLLRIKGWWRFGLLTLFLLFYNYLCSYSVSVVRASIMSVIMLLAPLISRRYDTLSAISIAGIIIYFFNPLCIFDVSFLMSFSCVLGIAFIFKPLAKVFKRIHLPNWLGDSLAISIATVVSLLLIMAYFFTRVSLISLLTNILILPLFTLAFTIVFILAFLSLLIPVLTYLLVPLNFLFNAMNAIIFVMSNLKIANITSSMVSYPACLVYFFLLLLLGRICTAENHKKAAATLTTFAILVACLI